MIEKLAKENEGREATDEEFAEALELGFFVEEPAGVVTIRSSRGKEVYKASTIERSLWDQLRHAYGFTARGTCNSLHEAQIDREEEEAARHRARS